MSRQQKQKRKELYSQVQLNAAANELISPYQTRPIRKVKK